MADIKKINVAGTTYDIVDDTALHEPTTWYGTCSTTSTTAEKVVTCSGFALSKGAIICIVFTTANTAATPTLNVNSTTAKRIHVGGATPNSTTNVLRWSANTLIYFMYDGTYYRYLTAVAAANVDQPRGANTWCGTCSTAAGTQAKIADIPNYVLTKGSLVSLTFTNGNTYVANKLTLIVNDSGTKDVYYNGAVTSSTNTCTWPAKTVITFIYDGTGYQIIAMSNYDNKYAAATHTHDYSKVSAASALTTGITTGTITIDGTTTTFYAPDGSTDYYIEASVSAITQQEGLLTPVTLTNGETYFNLNQKYLDGQTLYVKLTDSSTDDVYILSLNKSSNFGILSFTGDFPIPQSTPTLHGGLTVDISMRSGTLVTQAFLQFHERNKVCQNAVTTTAGSYPVMLGGTTATTAITSTLNKTDSLTYNPSTKLLQAGALGVISGIGYTTTLPTTTTGFEEGQIMFVVFDET